MTKTSIPKLHSIKLKSGAHADGVLYPDAWLRPENIPSINVLEGAILANLKDVVVLGYDQGGVEYVAGSVASFKDAAYMFSRGHLEMLRQSDDTREIIYE